MNAEQQYIDLFSQTEAMICQHSTEVMNIPRATAFADFERLDASHRVKVDQMLIHGILQRTSEDHADFFDRYPFETVFAVLAPVS